MRFVNILKIMSLMVLLSLMTLNASVFCSEINNESNPTPTEISINLSTNSLEIGSLIVVNGSISPHTEYDIVITLNYKYQYNAEPYTFNVSTDSGLFNHQFEPSDIGKWKLSASWEGDEEYEASQKEVSFKVIQQKWITNTFFLVVGIFLVIITTLIALPYARKRSPFRYKNKNKSNTEIKD